MTWTSEPEMQTVSSTSALRVGPGFYQMGETAWYLHSAWILPAMPWVLAFWIAGVAVFSLRLMLGLQWVSRACNSSLEKTDHHLQDILDGLLPRMGIMQSVSLRLCPNIDTPMAMGLLRPLVLFPIGLASHLSTDAVEALLAHELAHIKRQDYLVNLLQRVVETLLFYHPVVWWLSHRIRLEREHIADDIAAKALGSTRRMALALSGLSEWQPTIPLFANAAHGGQLMNRITRLIKPKKQVFGWKAALPALVLTLVCLTGVAKESYNGLTKVNNSKAGIVYWDSRKKADESFAIIKSGSNRMMMTGSTDHIDAIKRSKNQINGDFLWFSRNGEAFVIQDPAVVMSVTELWKPTEKLSAEMDVLSAEMEVHSRKMDALSDEMDKSAALIEAPSKGMQELAGKRERLAGKYEEIASLRAMTRNDSELAALDAREAALDSEQAVLDNQLHVLESRLENSQIPMEQIGNQMEAAGKPMEALGKQMEVLGGKLEKSSEVADRQTRNIISEAVSQGKAQPVGKL
jgi:beta-lactamase regulating signal transducer with metallopeptidase domain